MSLANSVVITYGGSLQYIPLKNSSSTFRVPTSISCWFHRPKIHLNRKVILWVTSTKKKWTEIQRPKTYLGASRRRLLKTPLLTLPNVTSPWLLLIPEHLKAAQK